MLKSYESYEGNVDTVRLSLFSVGSSQWAMSMRTTAQCTSRLAVLDKSSCPFLSYKVRPTIIDRLHTAEIFGAYQWIIHMIVSIDSLFSELWYEPTFTLIRADLRCVGQLKEEYLINFKRSTWSREEKTI